jgi:2-dehydro-3-deoxyphosphogalactonate aldolase
MTLEDALAETPIIAIIRGVTPDEAVQVGETLFESGIRVIETPLNSPQPLDSIARLVEAMAGRMVVGGGTMLNPLAVEQVAAAGGRICVSPNTDPDVIRRALELGLEPLPGFATASEAFQAVAAGARRLKLFPASTYGSGHVKALLDVLPRDVSIMPVGGVSPAQFKEWWAAGARGFGMGGDLYKPGRSLEDIAERGRAAVAAVRELQA